MLVLSRKSNESIIIGGNIEIVVLGVEGDNVKLGIRAPKEVDIYRKEIYLTIQAQNLAASKHSLGLDEVSKLFKK
ncbi:carbon storage regulator CsrA [Paenibacillus sp. LPE1-1-1.1]|uniref:carbon storage regulator CsrA n=1 Tax=Paenibacillaceae TaxID=186822 RepID=UPI00342E0611